MSDLKGNDIDDLFKRASDKYPLRTDSADWNKLAAALEKDPSLIIPPVNTDGDRRRKRRFFWLFLLLPLGVGGYYAWQAAGHNNPRTASSARIESSKQAPAQTGTNPGTPATSARSGTNAGTKATPAQPGTNPGTPAPSAQIGATPGIPARPAQPGTNPVAAARTGPVSSGSAQVPAQQGTTPEGSARTAPDRQNSGLQPSTQAVATPGAQAQAASVPGTRETRTPSKDAGLANYDTHSSGGNRIRQVKTQQVKTHRTNPINTTDPLAESSDPAGRSSIAMVAEPDPSFSTLNSQRVSTTSGVALDVTVDAKNNPLYAMDSSGSKNKNSAKRHSDAKNKKQSFFYAGLIVAPDLSTVKFQSVKGAGTTFGVLLGYQFNRKWAVETGAYLDHKKYYTAGEYFKGGGSNPPGKLLNVDGSCDMWEIPVNIRYNLSAGKKTKWFATAGLSTYLMTHESYVSTYENNGYTWPYPWSVTTPSTYLFSIINLSVGYEQKLGKIGNLRLEPYLRIPLAGIGGGRLPIMSAGLNIGITRRIW